MSAPALYLASKSEARARLLRAAGVSFDVVAVAVDEDGVKYAMVQEQAPPAHIAETLAELKALKGSLRHRGALVIGCDQVLSLDGTLFSKPQSAAEARTQLLSLRGRSHDLITVAVIARDGQALWRHTAKARLFMRNFSAAFVDRYLADMAERVTATVGAYEVEGLGAQLFDHIDGDHFTIQGLPLLPLLAILRQHGIVAD